LVHIEFQKRICMVAYSRLVFFDILTKSAVYAAYTASKVGAGAPYIPRRRLSGDSVVVMLVPCRIALSPRSEDVDNTMPPKTQFIRLHRCLAAAGQCL